MNHDFTKSFGASDAIIGFRYLQTLQCKGLYRNTRKLFLAESSSDTHPRVAEVVDDDVVAVVAVFAGVVEGAGHELVAGVPRRRHVEARAVGAIDCYFLS